MKYYIGVDLGGTNIAAGICDEDKKLIAKASVKTALPRPAENIADDIAFLCRSCAQKAGIAVSDAEWIGIGSPGTVNTSTGTVTYSCNLGFLNTPLGDLVSKRCGKTVFVDNDATAAAYGESLAGAGRGVKCLVVVTIGTGIGGGVILDGKTFGAFSGNDNEIGHMGIFIGGKECSCGRRGCAEMYCSATALVNITKEYLEKFPDSEIGKLCGENAENINGRTAFDAMRTGDSAGTLAVDEFISNLAYAVASYGNIFQPQRIIIGGGISAEGETLLAPLRKKVYPQIYFKDPAKYPEIVSASLGNDAGIIGAAMLGFNHR